MKNLVKMSRTTGFLEKAFRVLNEEYFDGLLEEPIVTVASTPRSFGHVSVPKVWRKGEESRHELNIGSGTLDRPVENVIATLLHEMVHLWNIREGIQDTSRGGSYHNKKFRDAAQARALSISYDKRIGWSVTEPTPELCDLIIAQGWSEIDMARREFSFTPRGKGTGNATGGTTPTASRTSSTRKYVCPCCGMSVRATKTVNVMCGDCNETMVPA